MTDIEPIMICFACRTIIPSNTPQYPGIRYVRQGRRSIKVEDHAVKCPNADNAMYHPASLGWNWKLLAQNRGAPMMRARRAEQRRKAAEARKVKP